MIRPLAFALMMIIGASVCSTDAPPHEPEWRTVYAGEAWYRERQEAEREWRGTLRPRTVVEGPNARTALRYDLLMADGAISVYAPAAGVLDELANQPVVIRGKQVDVGAGGAELWPGAIARAVTPTR